MPRPKTVYSSRRPSRSNFQSRRPSRPGKQYIHPSKFIKTARPVEEVVYNAKHTFDDFEINDLIKQNVINKGYVTPSPIQDQSIPAGLEGRDVIGIANTGTGKTAAFAIPMLNKLMSNRDSYALILAPTRELALQIQDECKSFATGSGLRGVLLIGGAPMGPQLRDLRARPNVVIGTPGRVKDHVERGTLDLSKFDMVVLDEVDRMVDMGFINDIRHLLGKLATPRQSFFFSATIDNKIETLMRTFLNDPIHVSVRTSETGENIEQNVIEYQGNMTKLEKLHDVLIDPKVEKVLVFDDTQRSVERLSKELQTRGFAADAIHGGKTQGARQRALSRFRNNEITILVATDVAARGIDVADITHVINFSQPNTYDDYVHRIGRAGRAGRIGYALTFVTNER